MHTGANNPNLSSVAVPEANLVVCEASVAVPEANLVVFFPIRK